MNSEELEQSLRTEFESHLRQISGDMQQEAAEFQEKIEAEFERHKSQITEVFQNFSARLQTVKELDASFRDSVVEHLRLARDEGARITAAAIGEAEEMEKAAAAAAIPAAGISQLRDAINDIGTQNSQASILKTLVSHAEQFTPRGAFFIIKNEHFVGWRVFGKGEHADDQAAREIFFPVSTDSTLGESVRSLTAVESSFGTNSGDSIYLDKLEFGEPDKIYAIPLVARGRGVAVLYADRGTKGEEVNIEALETLVRVAGLTVEVLAATPGAKPAANNRQSARQTQKPAKTEKQPDFDSQKSFTAEQNYQASEEKSFDQSNAPAGYDFPTATESVETAGQSDYQYPAESEGFSPQSDFQTEAAQSNFDLNNYAIEDYSIEEVETETATTIEAEDFQPVYQDTQTEAESYAWNQPAETTGEFAQNFETTPEFQNDSETHQPVVSEDEYSDATTGEYQFDADQSFDSAQNQPQETATPFDSSQYDGSSFESTPSYEPVKEESFGSFGVEKDAIPQSYAAKPVEAAPESAATKPVRSRFSDKNVDLPIEVTEDERRLHNDARRFARLLVSEIKLYNEQKVKEGRDGSDLYDRLREAIDRSREMYDKRIQPPVAAKFDYFHYEVVNTLAEGDEAKLGGSYPGATV
ncbi:MAG TPA: hypothetical protein VNI84_21780 [Pyrinomonadaceae bacterium]|nr:hypothetical protein [Pyrinomonadaceae bacterium]